MSLKCFIIWVKAKEKVADNVYMKRVYTYYIWFI